MRKVGRPTRLIAYDTIANQEAMAKGTTAPVKIFRARTFLYLGLIAIVGLIMLGALWHRSVLEANVMADRNPLFVQLANGDIRNGFTLKVLNKLHEPRTFAVGIEGLPEGSRMVVSGQENVEKPTIVVPTDVLSEIRVFVTVPAGSLGKLASQTEPFNFIVRDTVSDMLATRKATFRRP
jgi:polyferredoxin